MKLELEKLKKTLERSLVAKILVVLLAILLNVATYITAMCLVPIVGVLFTFGIPVLCGWKNIKFLLAFGVPVIIGTAIVVAAYQTSYVQAGQNIPLADDAGYFSNGTVTPYKGKPGDAFNFTVEIKKENNSNDEVYLILSKDLYILDDPMRPMAKCWEDATIAKYYINTSVEKSMIWYYTFSIKRNYQNGTIVWINLTKGNQQMIRVGPVTMEYNEMLISFLGVYLLNTFLMLGVGYYLLVSIYWWFGKARERREAILREMEARKETESQKIEMEKQKKTFKCSTCGAVVDETAEKCWKCGEKFEK